MAVLARVNAFDGGCAVACRLADRLDAIVTRRTPARGAVRI